MLRITRASGPPRTAGTRLRAPPLRHDAQVLSFGSIRMFPLARWILYVRRSPRTTRKRSSSRSRSAIFSRGTSRSSTVSRVLGRREVAERSSRPVVPVPPPARRRPRSGRRRRRHRRRTGPRPASPPRTRAAARPPAASEGGRRPASRTAPGRSRAVARPPGSLGVLLARHPELGPDARGRSSRRAIPVAAVVRPEEVEPHRRAGQGPVLGLLQDVTANRFDYVRVRRSASVSTYTSRYACLNGWRTWCRSSPSRQPTTSAVGRSSGCHSRMRSRGP